MSEEKKVVATAIKGGPLKVVGEIEVKLLDGTTEMKPVRSSFCRCGLSANQPYCDGAHKGSDFEAE